MFEIECERDVQFEGIENIGSYASSSHAERGFCKVCGTHLFVKDLGSGAYGVPPGLFKDEAGFKLSRQVFIDHKPGYYSLGERTQNITSAYIYEHYPETRETK